jgi:hypothetical protein
MKFICFLLSFLCVASLQARVIRLNNTGINCVNASECYTSWATAYASANNGDTIHVEPSSISYGNTTITKRLVILGNGFFHGNATTNGNEGLQHNVSQSTFDNFIINGGSSNTVVKGINAQTSIQVASNLSDKIENLVIIGCRAGYMHFNSTNNLFVSGLTISSGGNFSGNSHANTNFYVGNSVLYQINTAATSNGIFENNIVYGGSSLYSMQAQNCIVQNNISVTLNMTHTFTNCTVRNNMAVDASAGQNFGVLDNNLVVADMTTVFEDFNNTSNSFSSDSRWALKAASPAIATGYNGTNMGIFGGTSAPYRLSGMPNIPSIFKVVAPATTSGNTMNITFSTRVNN